MRQVPALPVAPLFLVGLAACAGRGGPSAARWDDGVAGHLLVAESPQALLDWVQASPDAREGLPGMLDSAVVGQRLFVRAALVGLPEGAGAADPIGGELRLRGPDGSVLYREGLAASAPEAPGVMVLMPGFDVIFDPGDPTGSYGIEADVDRAGARLSLTRALRIDSPGGDLTAPGTHAP